MPDEAFSTQPPVLTPEPPSASDAGDRLARKVLIPLAVFLVAVVLVFYVFFSRGRVVGPSMLPTLRNGDMVLLTKSYEKPERGDIVFTQVVEEGTPVEVVKRIIAVPGDTIEIRADTAVVNGVEEPQRGQEIDEFRGDSVGEYQVPEGTIYVMGDNRRNSQDSRYMGPVPIAGVMGRVVAVYAPITRVRLVR